MSKRDCSSRVASATVPQPKKTERSGGKGSSASRSGRRGPDTARRDLGPCDAATIKPKSKGGRPSKYTPELVDAICARMSKGEFLAVICRDEGMPDPSTIWDWQQGDSDRARDVSQRIARARDEGFDAMAREALSIADDGTRDYSRDEEGGIAVNYDHIQRSKLRVDTRLKLLAKWDPKRYGDKVQLADNEGGKLPEQQVVAINVIGVAAKHG